MRSKQSAVPSISLIVAFCLLNSLGVLDAQVPGIINYQGRIVDNGTNFNGTGQFQFALVSGTNTAISATATAVVTSGFITSYGVVNGGSGYTSSPTVSITDSTGSGALAYANVSGGSVISLTVSNGLVGSNYSPTPTVTIAPPPPNIVTATAWSNGVNTVALTVTKGLYSVLLGDTTLANMSSCIPATVFTNADVVLRVWFNDGVSGLQQLSPDQRIAAVGYALNAAMAQTAITVPAGAITSTQLAPDLAVSGSFSAGSISINGVPFLSTVGTANSFVGPDAGNLTMSGTYNTANGAYALEFSHSGSYNTANGAGALLSNAGSYNTANGAYALYSNTSGSGNTANGAFALNLNAIGYDNTANGVYALYSNTSGSYNTADGAYALYSNTGGSNNAAVGDAALYSNTSGYQNTANGVSALQENTGGYENTADGYDALTDNTSGNRNTAVGWQALANNSSGSSNIAIGYFSGYQIGTGSGNIDIGNTGVNGTESDAIHIGTVGVQTSTYIAGISGVTISPAGAAVYVNSNGELGTVNSSRRFKQDIRDMGDQSDVLLSLRPVAFRYKHDLDPQGLPQFGLIAEEVEKVAPELVLRDAQGAVYTVRYEQINAMLLNEFLKEHRQVQEQDAHIAALEKRLEQMEKRLEQVSERVEQSKAAPIPAANVHAQGGM